MLRLIGPSEVISTFLKLYYCHRKMGHVIIPHYHTLATNMVVYSRVRDFRGYSQARVREKYWILVRRGGSECQKAGCSRLLRGHDRSLWGHRWGVDGGWDVGRRRRQKETWWEDGGWKEALEEWSEKQEERGRCCSKAKSPGFKRADNAMRITSATKATGGFQVPRDGKFIIIKYVRSYLTSGAL